MQSCPGLPEYPRRQKHSVRFTDPEADIEFSGQEAQTATDTAPVRLKKVSFGQSVQMVVLRESENVPGPHGTHTRRGGSACVYWW